MKLAGVNEALVEMWMGHSIGVVRGAYLLPPVPELEKIYLENYKAIKVLV